MTVRRLLTVLVSAVAIMMLTATSAFAFHCYNASRSETGNTQAAANSQALESVGTLLDQVRGFCPAVSDEADDVEDAIVNEGLDPDQVVVHTKTLMASGAEGTGVLHDGRGIDHLPPSVLAELHELFVAIEQNCS